ISHQEGSHSLVGGVMLGYVHGSLDYVASDNTSRLDGMSTGVYGGYVNGAFYVDAALNATWMETDSDIPELNLDPAGTLASTSLGSMGLQAEAGFRLGSGQVGFEPMLMLDHV